MSVVVFDIERMTHVRFRGNKLVLEGEFATSDESLITYLRDMGFTERVSKPKKAKKVKDDKDISTD